MRTYLPIVTALLTAAPAAQSLLRDLNPEFDNPGSQPTDFTRSGGYVFFRANAGRPDLWCTDGTAAGTVALGLPAPYSWRERAAPEMVDLDGNGSVILTVNGATGSEPYVARSSPPSLQQLGDLQPGPFGSLPQAYQRLGNGVLFLANDQELWRTDGTPAGTVRVTTVRSGFATAVGVLGGRALWTIVGPTSRLIASFGTAASTMELAQISNVPSAVLANDRVYFVGRDAAGDELWVTDGTLAGTAMVVDLSPGPGSAGITRIVPLGSECLFARANELWRSDGTAAGTRLVASGVSILGIALGVTTLGDRAYFAGFDTTHGVEPWVSDGTAAGTRLLADLQPGAQSSTPLFLFASNTEVLFAADTPTGSRQLHRVSTTGQLTATAFSGNTAKGAELRSQAVLSAAPLGTGAGSEPTLFLAGVGRTLRDLAPAVPASSQPAQLTADGGVAYFVANGGRASGIELWRTDGSAAGTRQVADLTNGPGSSQITLVGVHDQRALLFVRDAAGRPQLHVADDTGVNSLGLAGFSASACRAPAGRGLLIGLSASPLTPNAPSLVVCDGTGAGTIALAFGLRAVNHLERVGERAFFAATTPNSQVLWSTDGTPAGTRQVFDFAVGQGVRIAALREFQGQVAVGIEQPALGLYLSDGTANGTIQLVAGNVSQVAVAGARIYFVRNQALWSSDGSPAGTAPLGLAPPTYGYAALTGSGQTLYAVAWTAQARELWAIDARTLASRIVLSLPAAEPIEAPIALGNGSLAFHAGSPATLYLTEGTVSSTRALRPPVVGVTPIAAAFDRGLLFAGHDSATGTEPWRLRFAELGLAYAASFGVGCSGSAGEPRLRANDAPRLGDQRFALELAGARAASATAFWLSATRGHVALPGACRIYVQPQVTLPSLSDARGAAAVRLAIPTSAELLGAELFAQAAVADPQGGVFGVLALSQGLELSVGR